MNWTFFLSIFAVVALMTGYEWPKLGDKKEKWAFAVMTGIGATFACTIAAFPNLPDPGQFLEFLYRPITRLVGK